MNLGRPVVINGDFLRSCERATDALFPNDFGGGLVVVVVVVVVCVTRDECLATEQQFRQQSDDDECQLPPVRREDRTPRCDDVDHAGLRDVGHHRHTASTTTGHDFVLIRCHTAPRLAPLSDPGRVIIRET